MLRALSLSLSISHTHTHVHTRTHTQHTHTHTHNTHTHTHTQHTGSMMATPMALSCLSHSLSLSLSLSLTHTHRHTDTHRLDDGHADGAQLGNKLGGGQICPQALQRESNSKRSNIDCFKNEFQKQTMVHGQSMIVRSSLDQGVQTFDLWSNPHQHAPETAHWASAGADDAGPF